MEQQERRHAELRGERRPRRERDRRRHDPPEPFADRRDASATMPAVAVTESWNPIDQTSHGSSTSSTSTAAARIEPVARGSPDQDADEREARHHPRAHHRGFGARHHDEEGDRSRTRARTAANE